MEELSSILKMLEELKVNYTKEIKRLNKLLEKASAGNLRVKKRGKSEVEYYRVYKGKYHYLSKKKDAKMIMALGDKRYAKHAIKNLTKNIAAIERFLGEVTADVGVFLADKLEEKGVPTTKRTCLSRKARSRKWLENRRRLKAKDLEENREYYEKYEESQFFNTLGGDIVRSKSEGLIADMLFVNNIPYIYEARLDLGNGRHKYPDFTIYDAIRDREIVYEHFGRMDDVGYVAKNFRKVDLCVDYGMHLGKNFFITFETQINPLTTKRVEETLTNIGVL